MINELLFNQIRDALNRLYKEDFVIWMDCIKDWIIYIDYDDNNNIISKTKGRILYSAFLKDFINSDILKRQCKDTKSIISIGTNKIQNKTKMMCHKRGYSLVTVPLPLSNDSFCTNRCSKRFFKNSVQCYFPDITIIDISLLKKVPFIWNVYGVGEFLGLYISVIDYCMINNLSRPIILLNYIKLLYSKLCIIYDKDRDQFLKILAISLIFKCLLMRVYSNYEIGCGADHLIANILKNKLHISHGMAVYYSILVTLAWFPEIEEDEFNINHIFNEGIKLGLINIDDLLKLFKIDSFILVKNALKSRPTRRTILSECLTKKKAGFIGWDRISKLIR